MGILNQIKACYLLGFWTKIKACYLLGFWTKIPKISNLKSIFKPIRKFSRQTPNIAKFILSELQVCKVSRNLRNIFWSFIIHHSFIPINSARVQVSLPRRLILEESTPTGYPKPRRRAKEAGAHQVECTGCQHRGLGSHALRARQMTKTRPF